MPQDTQWFKLKLFGEGDEPASLNFPLGKKKKKGISKVLEKVI